MNIDKIIRRMKETPKSIHFKEVQKVCEHYFGKPRKRGTSHCVYKTPWQGNPRINIQNQKGKSKPYQVKQVITCY